MIRGPPKLKRATKRRRTSNVLVTRKRQSTFPLRSSPIPPKFYSTLRYCQMFDLSLSVGTMGTYVFSANGLFDPNITGTGNQPLYFDQMMALYNHYHVKASRINIECCAANDLQTAVVHQLVIQDTSSLAVTSVVGMTQAPGKRKHLKPYNTADGNPAGVFTTWKATDVFGGDLLSNNRLRGDVSSNPTEQSYFIYGVSDINANTITMTCAATIEYDCIFTEFKGVGLS